MTVTEWAVRYTWNDGHTEIKGYEGRNIADSQARSRNFARSENGGASAEVVSRQVTYTDWQVTS